MTSFKDSLPQELVTHVTAMCGRRGEEWFDRLPEIIGQLESKWSLRVDDPFPGIEFNFVAPAVISDGRLVVVKIAPPIETAEIHCEAKHLRTLAGASAVRLLAEDRQTQAILIERAVPGLSPVESFSHDPLASIPAAIDVLRSILRPPPSDMTDVSTLDRWFANFRRRYPGSDFPSEPAEKAVETYERLSKQAGRTFYLHGDFHLGNIVSSDRAPFLAIDPKGLVGHIGYDIAVFLINFFRWQEKNENVERLLNEAIRQFADAFTLTEKAVREWAFLHMVIGAWWDLEDMPELYDADVAMQDIWGV
jgi:streptomycin 6-kinase